MSQNMNVKDKIDKFLFRENNGILKLNIHEVKDGREVISKENQGLIKNIENKKVGWDEFDSLIKHPDYHVRWACALYGRNKDLDILANDEDYHVRFAVCNYGADSHLDKFVRDEDYHVRCEVARHMRDKDLDILVNDDNVYVKSVVASIGRDCDLDKLISDEDDVVVASVLKHGRNQDFMSIKDTKNEWLRERANEILGEYGYSDLGEFCKSLGYLGGDYHTDRNKRLNLIRSEIKNKWDEYFNLFADHYADDKLVINKGREFDNCIEGYASDCDWRVREYVAKNSESNSKVLDMLVDDPCDRVRCAVVEQGRLSDSKRCLDDDSHKVRSAADKVLIDHGFRSRSSFLKYMENEGSGIVHKVERKEGRVMGDSDKKKSVNEQISDFVSDIEEANGVHPTMNEKREIDKVINMMDGKDPDDGLEY